MEIKTFGVIGAGQMGGGIAQVAATAGLDVIMSDIKIEFAEKGLSNITKILGKNVEKGRISAADRDAILGRIKITADLKDMAAVDFVVEAATENETLKFKIFKDLDGICEPDVILVIGMHFMNPVPVMKLVEVIRGLATTDETYRITWDLAQKFGKTPALSNDFPGFIANRILMPMINEAVFSLYHGVGTREDIDTVMKLGMNHPMGPLALADLIGLDTCLAIMETLYSGFSDSKYRPCPLLRKYVEAGWLGRKSGRGFYEY
jgi:3-hydroxybutyryl-CoA dehydrogenase